MCGKLVIRNEKLGMRNEELQSRTENTLWWGFDGEPFLRMGRVLHGVDGQRLAVFAGRASSGLWCC